MATIPTTPGFKTFNLGKRFSVFKAKSPASYAQQLQKRAGEEWFFSAALPPVTESQATAWITWLLAQEGMYNTFTLDVSDYDGGASGETSITFRLDKNDNAWSIADAMIFGIQFSATQAQ